ncbi:MAG TPA: Gmad2 immunoglobulin-like domain-containing protein [bacterium]|nr:Gmad2 immunoglobulin-like domain-containing protein [bacterium]
MKKNYLWLGPIIVLALALAIIIFLRLTSPEDTWLCQDGQWVKHGQPTEAAPATGCGDIADRDLTNDDSAERCLNGGGDWLADYQECENISRDLCEELDGRFNDCTSACRHNPEAEFCTMQCVAICQLSSTNTNINSFAACVQAGNPVQESYPRQCQAGNQTFIENIGNELDKSDLIRLDSPRPNQMINSPLTITGQARGSWFFEASFPVILTDWDGKIIAQTIATAQGDWMTEDFVPFSATVEFDRPAAGQNGSLILQKDNPSGLSEYDDALEVPVLFAE